MLFHKYTFKSWFRNTNGESDMVSNAAMESRTKDKVQVALASPHVHKSHVQKVISYGMLMDWIGRVIAAELGMWVSTPLGKMLVFNPQVSTAIGIDTDNNNIHLSQSLAWFAEIPWDSAAYMEDGLVFKVYLDQEAYWLKFHLAATARNILAKNCEHLQMNKIHFLSEYGAILSDKHVSLSRYEAAKPLK